MKRIAAILLILILLLSGCSMAGRNIKEPAEFYYLRSFTGTEDYKAYFSEGPIISELREVSGHRNDLYYLISMYLRGPISPDMVSPFPTGSAVTKIKRDGQDLYVHLNAAAANAEDLQLTLIWACLAKTCMALTDATTIHMESRGIDDKLLFQYTVTEDTLIWEESLPAATYTEETQ